MKLLCYYFVICLVFVNCKTTTEVKLKKNLNDDNKNQITDSRTESISKSLVYPSGAYLIFLESDKHLSLTEVETELNDYKKDQTMLMVGGAVVGGLAAIFGAYGAIKAIDHVKFSSFKKRQINHQPEVLSYSQKNPMSCGAACSITALKEVGGDFDLSKKMEMRAYSKTGMSDGEVVGIGQKAGSINPVQGFLARIFGRRRIAEKRGSFPKGVYEFLDKVEANPKYWFDPDYIAKMKKTGSFSKEMQVMGDYVTKNSDSMKTAKLSRTDVEGFLNQDGRLLIPFARRNSGHYYLVRKHKGKLVIMDPGDGKNFDAPEGFLDAIFGDGKVDLRHDKNLQFFGAIIGVKPN